MHLTIFVQQHSLCFCCILNYTFFCCCIIYHNGQVLLGYIRCQKELSTCPSSIKVGGIFAKYDSRRILRHYIIPDLFQYRLTKIQRVVSRRSKRSQGVSSQWYVSYESTLRYNSTRLFDTHLIRYLTFNSYRKDLVSLFTNVSRTITHSSSSCLFRTISLYPLIQLFVARRSILRLSVDLQ